ncbi:type II toxin-antitoxin system RelE/ParE family toxin [Prescottella subtropica]|uniref:type II toxin-antitoxin system RelE/ParE family toxin n=1 Tax=Prescottella subtropica TaxID=2545757 RepID=UPI0010F5B6F1|nr:type II toxin-antitoxin system RelE/ParE family toxin [Prescottella subtropica]
MRCEVVLLDEVEEWYLSLVASGDDDAAAVTAAIDYLEAEGPTLGRPAVDKVKGSRIHNMKELRPHGTSIRILFVFDPRRQAILLVAGDKAGEWKQWYTDNIPIAEGRYELWLNEQNKQ